MPLAHLPRTSFTRITHGWIVGVLTCALATPAAAQMTGFPVLQNAFTPPGIAVAVNVGTGSDVTGYGAAGSWAPGRGRIQLMLGVAAAVPDEGSTTATFGGRLAVPITTPWTGRPVNRFGLAVFAGTGGTRQEGVTTIQIPVGASVGWRRALGTTRALSIYAAPFYSWNRASSADIDDVTKGLVRMSIGMDFAASRNIGLSLGYELGSTAELGEPGATGGILGAGVAYAF
ncbi:MAG TPA: hypothetical protein VHQ45_15680 [Gemmatimonadaceae bacterium]|nr:hypothetical protein [Gemmatimonadaceae bacterium]